MRSRRSPLAIALVVLIGGLVTSVVAALLWRSALEDEAATRFARDARAVDAAVGERIDELAIVGRTARTDVAAVSELSNDSFGALAADAVAGLDAGLVTTVAWVQPANGDSGLDRLREDVRETCVRAFNINSPAPGDTHFVATYEAPATAVPVLGGLDLASVPAARAALAMAQAEDRAVISSPFERLPAATIRAYPSLATSGVAVAVPVSFDTAPADEAGQKPELRGWVVVMASAQDLLTGAVGVAAADIDAQLESLPNPDAPAAVGGALVASTRLRQDGLAPSLAVENSDSTATSTIERLGQRWQLTVVAIDGLGGAARREPIWILAAGAALSVLMAALVWTLGNTGANAMALAANLTNEVRRTEARFQALVQNLPNLIVVTDDERSISYVSPSVTTLLGWTVEEAQGALLTALIHPDDRAQFGAALASRSEGDLVTQARVLASNGDYRWFEGTITDLFDDAAVAGLVITAHDVTAQKAVENRLAHQATHDPLTRLPNRVIVDDRLDHALDRSRRDGSRAAAIFLDIDEFKVVNDTWGHAAGDELLRTVAERVQRAARSADTVGRYGGDEFVVICEDLPSAADALVVAERIRDEVAQPAVVTGGGDEVLVGTSIGVALSAGPGEVTSELLGRADAAMYEAKARGRGRIVVDSSL